MEVFGLIVTIIGAATLAVGFVKLMVDLEGKCIDRVEYRR